MKEYHGKGKRNQRAVGREAPRLPARVMVSLAEVAGAAKEGLLALSVAVGMRVLGTIMEEEVTEVAGPKGKHNPERKASRHGQEKGYVVLGGRRVTVGRPRVRTRDGREVQLESYAFFQREDLLTQAALERMLLGVACRRYGQSLEPVGADVEAEGVSKSAVSRRFIQRTKTALAELLSRPLADLRILALLIDGVGMAEHTCVVVMGIDADGKKHVLGLREGATENATVCRALLSDLVERGLRYEDGLLVVMDGSKALRAAVRDTFGGCAAVQRCQVHKKRNVLDHLPEKERLWVSRKLDQAWREANPDKARESLKSLASALERNHPGAAASLREGLEETLTVARLGLPPTLRRTLRSTNPIESAFETVRRASRNVKRWRNG